MLVLLLFLLLVLLAGASNVSVSGAAWSSWWFRSLIHVSSSGTKVTEGNGRYYLQLQPAQSVSADTTFSWTVVGDTNTGTAATASATDIDAPSGTANYCCWFFI